MNDDIDGKIVNFPYRKLVAGGRTGLVVNKVSFTRDGSKRIQYAPKLDARVTYRRMSFAIFRSGVLVYTMTYHVPAGAAFYSCPTCVERGKENPTQICRGIDICPDCRYEMGDLPD